MSYSVILPALHSTTVLDVECIVVKRTVLSNDVLIRTSGSDAIEANYMASEAVQPMLLWHTALGLKPVPTYSWATLEVRASASGEHIISVDYKGGFEFEKAEHATLFKLTFGGDL